MGIFSKKTAAVASDGPVERGDATEVTLVAYTAVPAANQKFTFPLSTTVEEALKAVCLKFNVPFCEHYGLYLPSPYNSYLDNDQALSDTKITDKVRPASITYSCSVRTTV